MSKHAAWILGLVAVVVCASCGSEGGTNGSGGNGAGSGTKTGSAPVSPDGTVDLSAEKITVHKLTMELVNLMDQVNRLKIMSPPIPVSDARNAFFERLDWMDQMNKEDVAKMREAIDNLEGLLEKIRSHENAADNEALKQQLSKIESLNNQLRASLPANG